MALSAEQTADASGKWARSLTINAAALVISRYVFSGFEIHGVLTYLAAAAAIELPTIAWLLVALVWMSWDLSKSALEPYVAVRLIWVTVLLMLSIGIPLVLATAAPGLAVAASITSLKITGWWTFVGASAITAALTIGLGQSRPLKSASRFVKGFAPEEQRAKSEESNRAFRESRRAVGPALRDSFLSWWITHRQGIRWTERGLRVGAMIVGTVTVGLWFGFVLGVAVWLLPAAILWPLVRSHKKSRVPQ